VRCSFSDRNFALDTHKNGPCTFIQAVDGQMSCLPCYPVMVLGRTYAALFLGLYRMFRHKSPPATVEWVGQGKRYQHMLSLLVKYSSEKAVERKSTGARLARNRHNQQGDDESYSLWACVAAFGRTDTECKAAVAFLSERLQCSKSGQRSDVRAATVHQDSIFDFSSSLIFRRLTLVW